MSQSAQSEPRTATKAPRTWKLTLSYDGTDFRGWQVQPGHVTVQGELQSALRRITGEGPLPQGSGRTDAGVHALAQVASFALHAPIPADSLLCALNRTLPRSIRILQAALVPAAFHARHSAIAKTYEYRVWLEKIRCGTICPPFLARFVYGCGWELSLPALQQAARHFIGEHDFLSFAATDPDLSARNDSPSQPVAVAEPPTAVRTIYSSTWEEQTMDSGDLLVYRVRGNGFLHHMVRNLVGTMLDCGRGHLRPDAIPAILSARSRAAAGPTAPARGLFLHSVEYGD